MDNSMQANQNPLNLKLILAKPYPITAEEATAPMVDKPAITKSFEEASEIVSGKSLPAYLVVLQREVSRDQFRCRSYNLIGILKRTKYHPY